MVELDVCVLGECGCCDGWRAANHVMVQQLPMVTHVTPSVAMPYYPTKATLPILNRYKNVIPKGEEEQEERQ